MEFFRKALIGVSWMGALRVSLRLVGLAKIAILARILTPEQFGLFGIATLVLAFLEIITETGINVFLIQEKADLEKYLDTAWIVSILRGLVISLLILIFSPAVAVFFKAPESRLIFLILSGVPLVRGFINPAMVRFQKELRFSREFAFRLTVFTVDAAIAVVLALKLDSAASLVWALLAGAGFEAFLSFLLISPRPRLAWQPEKLRRIVRRGKWLTLAGLFNYLYENVDNAAIGRLLGLGSLGLYQNVYKICSLPLTEVAEVVKRVTFPIYVNFQADLPRLKKAFLKSIMATAILAIPPGLVFLFFSEPVIRLVLGPNWLAAVPVLRVLSFLGVIRALIAATYPVFLSLKRQRLISFSTLAAFFGLAVTVVPLTIQFGIVGAGLAAVFGSICEIPLIVYFLIRIFAKKR